MKPSFEETARTDLADTWIITGPTGSGKSDIALRLAERWDAEIIAMDSMTLYRGMDIGTAKPSADDRRRVRHHLIDVREPWESSSVVWWLNAARECEQDIRGRGKRIAYVGGTPLYLKALLQGLCAAPPADEVLRSELRAEAERHGTAGLHQRLAEVDPASAARLHPNDLKRVVRALEVYLLTHRPISDWQQEWHRTATAPGVRCWWLDRPRAELYRRIDSRVDSMIASGWLDEARMLRDSDRPMSRESSRAVGYSELFRVVDGEQSLADAVERIKTATRQFAKRQLTWFRNMAECRPISTIERDEEKPEQWPEFA